MGWFEDAYFLFNVRIFKASFSKSNANQKKIYCVDHAFGRSVTSGILVNSGHLLENIVFVALLRFNSEIYYYKTANNHEIDFIVQNQQRQFSLIQVCQSLVNPSTRQRETTALQTAMIELKLSEATIVTRDESESILVTEGIINAVPIWRFILNINKYNIV